MMIIILRIPPSATKSDLRKAVRDACASRFRMPFSEAPKITSVDILRITEPNGHVERHGVIEVQPERAARRAISRLNCSRIKGKLVMVREYCRRSRHSRGGTHAGERRRLHVKVEFESYPVVVGL